MQNETAFMLIHTVHNNSMVQGLPSQHFTLFCWTRNSLSSELDCVALALWICIPEVCISNPRMISGYPDRDFSWFCVPRQMPGLLPSNRPRLLASKFSHLISRYETRADETV
jgi:hypothetical protein